MKPNPTCDDRHCCAQQKAYQIQKAAQPVIVEETNASEAAVTHEENDWGISLVDESVDIEEVTGIMTGSPLI